MREIDTKIVIHVKTAFADEESTDLTALACFEQDLECAQVTADGQMSLMTEVWNIQNIELAESPERRRILQAAIDTWGIPPQLDMMVEEMSELTKAICKYKRGARIPAALIAHIREEMADVRIMLDQMDIIFGKTDDIEQDKLNRLDKRIQAIGRTE